MTIEIEKVMDPDEMKAIGVASMTQKQREALLQWGMRVYALGQHVVADIEAIKYDGHLILLDDGSRWEVDDTDTDTADLWSELDTVVVIDGEMYRLDALEKISVTEDALCRPDGMRILPAAVGAPLKRGGYARSAGC